MEQNTVEQIKKKIMETERQDARFADLDLSETKIEKFTPLISNLIENCKNLEIIYFVDCNITSLTGFPPCNIKAVDFSKNLYISNYYIELMMIAN
jgi:Leucine-rich repeat (LRR) protein